MDVVCRDRGLDIDAQAATAANGRNRCGRRHD
jgi:hypothetical protein